ncbi:hypothetical protein F-E9_512 [Faustovirus]|nr:hypothetical protein F-E9_512 [Faustovirus]
MNLLFFHYYVNGMLQRLPDEIIMDIIDIVPIIYGRMCSLNRHYYNSLIGVAARYKRLLVTFVDERVTPIPATRRLYCDHTYWHLPNGALHGTETSYFGEQITSQREFADGVLHGESINYYIGTNISFKSHYKHGLRHGEYIEYTLDGAIKTHGYYHLGNWHGKWIYYYGNGRRKRFTYEYGKLHGIATTHNEQGDLIVVELWNHDNCHSQYSAKSRQNGRCN